MWTDVHYTTFCSNQTRISSVAICKWKARLETDCDVSKQRRHLHLAAGRRLRSITLRKETILRQIQSRYCCLGLPTVKMTTRINAERRCLCFLNFWLDFISGSWQTAVGYLVIFNRTLEIKMSGQFSISFPENNNNIVYEIFQNSIFCGTGSKTRRTTICK